MSTVIRWVFSFFLVYFSPQAIIAHDYGQWEEVDPATKLWFRGLTQPDNPTVSCCGEADAYWADEMEVKGDDVYAIITDTRDDTPLRRPHVPVGTKILVPKNKIKWDKGNPTGHTLIFIGTGWNDHIVYCYVQGTGS